MKGRNTEIDTLRGLACILLVAYHVIGPNSGAGLKIEGGWIREINNNLAYFRMPLFTFLSGYVYAYRPFQGNVSGFLKGKLRRLIVPMLVVGTIFAMLQAVIPGSNHSVPIPENWFLLHIIPYGHYWFIESLFDIFLVVLICELLKLFNSRIGTSFVFIVAVLLYLSPISLFWFSVTGAIRLFPFFLLGMACYRLHLIPEVSRKLAVALLFPIVIAYALSLTTATNLPEPGRNLFSLTAGILFCTAMLASRINVAFLANIGYYSYAVYLYHVFFTASSRVIFNKFGVENIGYLFVLGLFFGIAGPIVVELIMNKANLTRLLFLGKGPVKAQKPLTNTAESRV